MSTTSMLAQTIRPPHNSLRMAVEIPREEADGLTLCSSMSHTFAHLWEAVNAAGFKKANRSIVAFRVSKNFRTLAGPRTKKRLSFGWRMASAIPRHPGKVGPRMGARKQGAPSPAIVSITIWAILNLPSHQVIKGAG